MKIRYVCYAFLFLFFLSGFSLNNPSDWTIQKCEEWRKIKKPVSVSKCKVIKDESKDSDLKRSSLKIVLPNGIEALLISDPDLLDSAAAISVGSGTWDDPEEYPGMAHFIEHLLFLGTEAYPRESEYSQYILEHGGQYNAFTKHDRTTYGFSIPSNAFSGALDRLAHFFIDPLFTCSAIEREVYAVHHEFEDSIENDTLRVWRVLKESGNLKHPNFKLSCGNLKSLSGIDREDILNWYKAHYHPSNMKLVLMSHESLESLAEKAFQYFSPISGENRKKEKEKIDETMTSSFQKGNFIFIKPSFKNRSLYLMWEIPSFFLTLENSKAVQLLQMALDHGHSNSLSSVLERDLLAKEVHTEFWKVGQGNAFFMINVVLTPKGLTEYEEVTKRCFQALTQIKNLGIPPYLLKRLKHLESSLLYSPFDSSFDYVMRVSSELLDENISTYPHRTHTATLESIEKVRSLLLELNPFQCLYFLSAASEELSFKLSRIEKWMGSEYLVRKIPEEKLVSWNEAPGDPLIGFQPEEEILPPKRDHPLIETEIEEKEVPDPIFLIDDSKASIRWIESSAVSSSVDAFFCIETPLMKNSAKSVVLNEFFISRINEHLKEEFIEEKEVTWNLEMEGASFCIFVSIPLEGYFENFQRFFKAFKKTTLSRTFFEEMKKEKMDGYPGDPLPMEYAHQILDSFLMPFHYTKMELYHTITALNFEDFEEFQDDYFKVMFLEGAFLGGVDRAQIQEVWKEVERIFDAQPYFFHKDRAKQFVFPKDQSYLVLQKTHRKGNALLLLIQSEEASKKLEAIYKILTVVLHSEFFQEIRTKQQTAYRLYTWSEQMNQKVCQCFGVQSSTHSPLDLLRRVEFFLKEFALASKEIFTRERFEGIRDTLILVGERQRNHMDKTEDLAFVDEAIEVLSKLTYEEVLEEISSVFSEENRKRIAILVEGRQSSVTQAEDYYTIPYLPIEKEKFHN